MKLKCSLLIISFVALFAVPSALADEPLATLKTLASKDTLAIAWIDLEAVELNECIAWASKQKIVDSQMIDELETKARMAQELIDQASDAGVNHVFALVHQDDVLFRGPPVIAFVVSNEKKNDTTIQSLRRILELLEQPDLKLEVWNGTILVGTEQQISRVKAEPSVERPRLVKAWEKYGDHDAGAIIIGNSNTRRVVRELFPKLEAPFENVTGKMIADDIDSIGVFVGLPQNISGKLVINTSDAATAKSIKRAAEAALNLVVSEKSEFFDLVPSAVRSAVSALKPEVNSNALVVDLQPIFSDGVKLRQLLEPITSRSRESQRLNSLRQMILAMHNYESKNKRLPAYANFDGDGKPLLSWRVHILPFIEQAELYDEFKLDEPWDSPHNIKLVERMPKIYADSSFEFADLKEAGKTRFVVPYADGTVFHGSEGATFGSMKDGSSNTIAIVCAAPEIAVVWTKPDDWKVDLDDPKKGLFRKKSTHAPVVYADGSAHLIMADSDEASLRALLTKDGGEVVP